MCDEFNGRQNLRPSRSPMIYGHLRRHGYLIKRKSREINGEKESGFVLMTHRR